MRTLYLTANMVDPDTVHVETILEIGIKRYRARSEFRVQVDARDRERLRWYLEDYPEATLDPAPRIANWVEQRLHEVGTDLFRAVFLADRDAKALWTALHGHLPETRIEVSASLAAEAALPWELLREPATGTSLALSARAFVRVPPVIAQPPFPTWADSRGRMRVLLVISRPAGSRDVPFRSVAGRMYRLGLRSPEALELDVLRPPTLAQLARTLQAARQAGQPYHVVHFDGHGTWMDAAKVSTRGWSNLNHVTGPHGYLLFEDPDTPNKEQLVDGPTLGSLLSEGRVPFLILNACRSAHAEPVVDPDPDDPVARDVEGRVQAYRSLAYEALEAGVGGVVAMRYNIYASTAATFVNDLYDALLHGVPLGEASTLARRRLATATRDSVMPSGRVQDWMVPVVFESRSTPGSSFSRGSPSSDVSSPLARTAPRHDPLYVGLPSAPEVGFQGRDDALLALDRAFDRHLLVLLHGPDGSGKTTTAGEFGRWYRDTGGLGGPNGDRSRVVYTSLQRDFSPERLLDRLSEALGDELGLGVDTKALTEAERRARTLELLGQVRIMWVWDDLECVTQGPRQPGRVSAPEWHNLRILLDRLSRTRTQILLLSTEEEREFLGDIPLQRIELRPMTMRDRLELARALASQQDCELTDAAQWLPLLRYGGGSPLVTRLVVQQALHLESQGPEQLDDLLVRLQSGETDLADHGTGSPLASSLRQALTAFTARERTMLALLHLFRTNVSLDAFSLISGQAHPVSGGDVFPTPEEGREFLERAADVGVLERRLPGHFSIHPMLRSDLRRLFSNEISDTLRALHAYADNLAYYGQFQAELFSGGEGMAPLIWLALNEDNLLSARDLGRAHRWSDIVVAAAVALVQLYEHTGRSLEHARILEELRFEVTDTTTGGPLPGQEEHWIVVHHLVVARAVATGNLAGVEQIQRDIVTQCRAVCDNTIGLPLEALDPEQHYELMRLIRALKQLGDILLEHGRTDCVESYREALTLAQRFESPLDEAAVAMHLGHAYLNVQDLRDFNQAERWYIRSLELRSDDDKLGRAKCLGQIGAIAYRRLREADKERTPAAELDALFETAVKALEATLRLVPATAVRELQITHHKLGDVYSLHPGYREACMRHWEKALEYAAAMHDPLLSGKLRIQLAMGFVDLERIVEAFEYASSAIEDFRRSGLSASEELESAYGFSFAIPIALTAGFLKAQHDGASQRRLQVLRDNAVGACRFALEILSEEDGDRRASVLRALEELEGGNGFTGLSRRDS